MIIRLDPFLAKLAHLPYLYYQCECIEKILFITLYGREEMDKYIILEPVNAREYYKITMALATYQQPTLKVDLSLMGMQAEALRDSFQITDESQAYFAILFACLAADETIHHQEVACFNHLLFQQGLFIGKAAITLFKQVYGLHQAVGGSHALIQLAAGYIREDNKEKVYTDALLAMIADGAYNEKEQRVLASLQQALALSNPTLACIQKKMSMLH